MVVCADDCAVMSGNKAVGRRGLAGSLFLMKVFSFFFKSDHQFVCLDE